MIRALNIIHCKQSIRGEPVERDCDTSNDSPTTIHHIIFGTHRAYINIHTRNIVRRTLWDSSCSCKVFVESFVLCWNRLSTSAAQCRREVVGVGPLIQAPRRPTTRRFSFKRFKMSLLCIYIRASRGCRFWETSI